MKAMSTRQAMAMMPDATEPDRDGDEADGDDERAKLKMEGVSSDELTNKNRIHHSAAYDVILFVKEIVCEYPNLTESILQICSSPSTRFEVSKLSRGAVDIGRILPICG